jgi:hypothetical protein
MLEHERNPVKRKRKHIAALGIQLATMAYVDWLQREPDAPEPELEDLQQRLGFSDDDFHQAGAALIQVGLARLEEVPGSEYGHLVLILRRQDRLLLEYLAPLTLGALGAI